VVAEMTADRLPVRLRATARLERVCVRRTGTAGLCGSWPTPPSSCSGGAPCVWPATRLDRDTHLLPGEEGRPLDLDAI